MKYIYIYIYIYKKNNHTQLGRYRIVWFGLVGMLGMVYGLFGACSCLFVVVRLCLFLLFSCVFACACSCLLVCSFVFVVRVRVFFFWRCVSSKFTTGV